MLNTENSALLIRESPQTERFKQQLRDSFQREPLNSRPIKVARHANVYTCGDQNEMVYFIESGQVKLLMLSSEGKQCILAIQSAGDMLGQTLLQLARTMGKKGQGSTRINLRISHEELSEMVGTTRPRVSLFMQRFQNLGLIDKNSEHILIIKEDRLAAYLAQIA